jgi:hypothetical protein
VTELDPHLLLLAALTTAVGAALIRIGVAAGQLKPRAARRKCPCCGRLLSPSGCDHCGI